MTRTRAGGWAGDPSRQHFCLANRTVPKTVLLCFLASGGGKGPPRGQVEMVVVGGPPSPAGSSWQDGSGDIRQRLYPAAWGVRVTFQWWRVSLEERAWQANVLNVLLVSCV